MQHDGLQASSAGIAKRLRRQAEADRTASAAAEHDAAGARLSLRGVHSKARRRLQLPMHPVLSQRRNLEVECAALCDEASRAHARAASTQEFAVWWPQFTAGHVRREGRERRVAAAGAKAAERVVRAMAVRRTAARARQQAASESRRQAVLAVQREAQRAAERALADRGKRVREVCEHARQLCVAAAAELERAAQRQRADWLSPRWALSWSADWAAGIL